MNLGQIQYHKPRNAGTSNFYLFALKNWFFAKFHIKSLGMQEHQTVYSKNWCSVKFHIKSREMQDLRTITNSFKKNWFRTKFNITSIWMQEQWTFISLLLKIDFEPNFTLKDKECRNNEQFAPKNLFWAKIHITSQECRNI